MPTDFEVRLLVDGAVHVARCTSLSLGGMFVETGLGLKYETRVALEFAARAGRKVLHLEGTVRWLDARGFGVQFSPMGAEETNSLSVLIEQAKSALDHR